MVNMVAASESLPDDESPEGWALGDSDGDTAYVDKQPTVRSQLFSICLQKNP